MSLIDLWKLATELSVVHAALLIAGQDPSDFENLRPENFGKRAPQFLPAKIALCNAILSGTLKPARESFYTDGDGQISGLDIYETTLKTTDIATFVRSRGFVCEIFDVQILILSKTHREAEDTTHPSSMQPIEPGLPSQPIQTAFVAGRPSKR